ncbi:MAG: tetratricopeptide repeat protein [Bdellovibrionales bacterium]|nr:tetratricopeptide repeat protein [Bdellovibrionales bacterium]
MNIHIVTTVALGFHLFSLSISAMASDRSISVVPSAASTLAPSSEYKSKAQDSGTTDLLIGKFEKVYLNLPPEDESKIPVTLRLADLLAEKARHLSNEEAAKGCTDCGSGNRERERAIGYYSEVVNKLSEDRRSRVLSQMGHLYELNGESNKAFDLYRKIIETDKNPEILAEAQNSQGDLMYRRRQFKEALKYYEEALNFKDFANRGYVRYRQAWCHFNMGELDTAKKILEDILQSPNLLTRSESRKDGIISIDKQFQEEVSRDLATFVSRKGTTMADIEMIYNQSPESARVENVTFLANELERLGQASQSAGVWKFLLNKQSDPVKRLEGHVRLAQLESIQNHRDESIQQFEKAMNLWRQIGNCVDGSCKELKQRTKNYVVDWNREEKINPGSDLLTAYEKYLEVFNSDLDMVVWAALLAQQRKDWKKAMNFFDRAAMLRLTTEPNYMTEMPSYEKLLLSQIEVGEKSGSDELLDYSFDNYVRKSKERSKWVEVSYHKAHRLYKKADYTNAALALHDVALMPENQSLEIKIQAADLAMDSLVILKRDGEVEKWALEFSKIFKDKANEYEDLARRSVLNQAVAESDRLVDLNKIQKAWRILDRFKIQGAKDPELISYYKTKLIYAEKLRDLSQISAAIEKLISIKSINEKDLQVALASQAWLAELKLDFKTALKVSEKMKSSENLEEQFLKLAMYADLVGVESKPYYQEFLHLTKDPARRFGLAVRLVRESNYSQKVFDEFAPILKADSEAYAQLQYEIYVKFGDRLGALKRLSGDVLSKTESAKSIWREDYLARYNAIKDKIQLHSLSFKNDAVLARTLKDRMAMLNKLEVMLKEAMAKEDWTSQMLTVGLLGQESNRIYSDILALPVPSGMNEQQQTEYLQLLSQQAAPHQIRGSELTTKFAEFWSHEDLLAGFREKLSSQVGIQRDRYLSELKMVAAVAPDSMKKSLEELYTSLPNPNKVALPSLVELEGARSLVRDNPFDRDPLEKLLVLERKMGKEEMVGYLERRLAQLSDSPQVSTKRE